MSDENQKGGGDKGAEKPVKGKRMVLLHNKRPQIIHVPTNWQSGMVTSHKDVLPGINELPESLVEQMKAHPVLKHHFADEELVVLESAQGKPLEGISGLAPAKAKKLIADTVDLELLKRWQDEEKRGDVNRALQNQIDKIETPDSKDKESGGGKNSKDGE